MKIWMIIIFLYLFFSPPLYAGGMVAKRQNAQKQIQQQIIMQQQAAIEQQVAIAQQRALREAQAVAQQRARQQSLAVAQQQAQAIAQYQAERIAQEAAQQQVGHHLQLQHSLPQQIYLEMNVPVNADVIYQGDSATLEEVVEALRSSSRDWDLIVDFEAKVLVVAQYIEEFRRQGIVINGPPQGYVGLIDGMAQQSPDMLNQPFEQVMQVAAIIQYDLNNGQDKDAMALKVLGSREAVIQNKKRLGLE